MFANANKPVTRLVLGAFSFSKQSRGRIIRRQQRCMGVSTTVNPEYDADSFILRTEKEEYIPECTLPEVVWENLGKWADKPALICNETGRQYKYVDIRRRTINLAKSLRGRLKLQPGDTVAILLPNVPEFPIALLGIIEAGLVATTVNPIYKAEEISTQLIDSGAKALITLGECFQKATDAIRQVKKNIPILTIKTMQGESTTAGAIDFGEFCERETSFEGLRPGHPDDVCVMPYSSGTTGLPKGVELTHRNIVSNVYQCVDFPKFMRETTKDNQDVVPAVLPMFHIYGMTVNALKMLSVGCKMITLPKFTPDIYTDMLEKHRPHHLFLVPPIVIFLAAHPNVTPKHLESVLTLMSGAAPLGASDVERLFLKTKREIPALQGYGMTETSPVLCMTPPEIWKDCLGSIGKTIPNTEIKIVGVDDPKGIPLGPNERGEMLVRGPQVMPRYHNNEKATDEVFCDGWLRTGDMAYYDEKKILWITDRLKELIKVKGFQVAPAELEAIVRDHPKVADAAVIGIPHPINGEVPKAFVVANANTTINPEEIQDYVAQKVASYKRLDGGVTILDAIPKNPSGKIMRRTLKSDYADK